MEDVLGEITYGGAAVHHQTKKIGCIVNSVMEGEAEATERGRQFTAVANEIERGLGATVTSPVFIGTDNFSNALVAADWTTPARSRHFYHRYYLILQAVRRGDVRIGHVPDAENPSDFLTKWVTKAKFEASINYLTNRKALANATASNG